jgi:hypothetical protein
MARDLSQSHCNFKWHVKSPCHRLSPFLPFLLSPLGLPPSELDPVPFQLLFCILCYSASSVPVLLNTSCNHFARTPLETLSSIVQNACLQLCCLAMDALLLLSAFFMGMCLPAHCLAMGVHVSIWNKQGNPSGHFIGLCRYYNSIDVSVYIPPVNITFRNKIIWSILVYMYAWFYHLPH